MWRGECEVIGWDDDGFVVIIAAATGSVLARTVRYTKIFFDERTKPEIPLVTVPWSVEPLPMSA